MRPFLTLLSSTHFSAAGSTARRWRLNGRRIRDAPDVFVVDGVLVAMKTPVRGTVEVVALVVAPLMVGMFREVILCIASSGSHIPASTLPLPWAMAAFSSDVQVDWSRSQQKELGGSGIELK
jgi:hypothetical protein